MTASVVVPLSDVQDARVAAQAVIREADLVSLFRAVDAGPYGLTVSSLALLEAVEVGLAVTSAVAAAVYGRIGADRRAGFAASPLTDEERVFCGLIGTFAGAREALVSTEAPPSSLPPAEKHLPLDDYRALLSATGGAESGGKRLGGASGGIEGEAERLVHALARDLAGYLTFYRDHDNPGVRLSGPGRLRACVGSYFQLLATTAARLGDDAVHAAPREALEEAGLLVLGATYRGFRRETAAPVEEERTLLPLWPGDIVGNTAVIDAGLDLARAVAGFDLARGVNPMNVRNPVLFVLGAPGCGKTVTAHAIGNYFLDLCRDNEIPARFRIIRRTDWASHYQNKSANELLRIFRDEVFDFPGVVGVYWPDIDTAFAAREDPGIRAEEKAVLGTLFGLLDGTVGPRNGKWFLIADANFLTMDEAMLSRLAQDPFHAKGPQTPADYVSLLRDKKLGKVAAHVHVSEAEWQAFGERCVAHGLSGRAIDNLAGKLMASIDDVVVPDHYFGLSFEEKVAVLDTARNPVDGAQLDALVERYVAFERDAEEKAREDRFARRVTEIREQLAARLAALGPTAPLDPVPGDEGTDAPEGQP